MADAVGGRRNLGHEIRDPSKSGDFDFDGVPDFHGARVGRRTGQDDITRQ